MVSFFSSAAYEVTRYAPGSYVDGHWVAGAPTVSTVSCTLRQPLGGIERQDLELGVRESVTHKLYTEGDIQAGDEIDVDGETYLVVQIKELQEVIPHTKVYLTRKVEP